MIEQYYFKMVK